METIYVNRIWEKVKNLTPRIVQPEIKFDFKDGFFANTKEEKFMRLTKAIIAVVFIIV